MVHDKRENVDAAASEDLQALQKGGNGREQRAASWCVVWRDEMHARLVPVHATN